jgi:ADP-dependent NAD(P)H-hydrate dehydratase / NAD(P)H-hydrate epimerase
MPLPSAPHPILPPLRSWPLHDATASRAIERAAAATLPAHTLMARAGESVARLALAIAPHARTIEVWCGPGNNGGDGFIAARWLQSWGKAVRVVLIGDTKRAPDDARHAWQQALDAGVPIVDGVPDRVQADLVVDALLGLGVDRDLSGAIATAVDCVDAADAPVLAVDVPTGLQSDTGAVCGRAVRAAHTLSLLTLKAGLFTAQGRDHAGRVWFDDLGVPASASTLELIGPEAARMLSPSRLHAQHKGSFGDVVVIGGARGMVGAAMLAARAAATAGAGRVYLGLLAPTDAAWFDSAHPELMARSTEHLLEPALLSQATVVCGCGGGDAVREALPPLLHHAPRLLLDADALNAIATDDGLRKALRARATRQHATLLTPHPLEAARWLGIQARDVQADRVKAAQALAEAAACSVLLKGSGSVIASPRSVVSINPTGDARLATAGSGDVLAGWAGGMWSAASGTTTAHAVAQASAWLHGAAVAHAPLSGPLRASQLIEAIAQARDACAHRTSHELNVPK